MCSSEMVLNWRRNEINLENIIYSCGRFQVRVLNNHEKPQALQLILLAIYRRHDPIITALRFNEVSHSSLRKFIKKHLDQNVACGYFQKEEGEDGFTKLVAVDALYVRNLRDELNPSKDLGEAFCNWIIYIKRIEKHVWSMGQRKICNILTSFGVFFADEVRRKKNGRNTEEHNAEILKITTETMKLRKLLAKGLGIQVVGAAYIGEKIQKAVEKDGFQRNKYKILYKFVIEDCKELGLGDISKEEKIRLRALMPILVMGLKQCLKREITVEEARRPSDKRMRVE